MCIYIHTSYIPGIYERSCVCMWLWLCVCLYFYRPSISLFSRRNIIRTTLCCYTSKTILMLSFPSRCRITQLHLSSRTPVVNVTRRECDARKESYYHFIPPTTTKKQQKTEKKRAGVKRNDGNHKITWGRRSEGGGGGWHMIPVLIYFSCCLPFTSFGHSFTIYHARRSLFETDRGGGLRF